MEAVIFFLVTLHKSQGGLYYLGNKIVTRKPMFGKRSF